MHIEVKHEYPLVSVIAVSYNHARWVIECLESIKAQTYPKIELIYADDGSEDGSASLAVEWIRYRWPQAKTVIHQVNRGLCATLNEGLSLATGGYIQLLSTDDVLAPEKFARQVPSLLASSSEAAFSFGNFGKINENSEIIEPYAYPLDSIPPQDLLSQVLAPQAGTPSICMATVLLKREPLGDLLTFDETLAFEGIQLWLKVLPRFGGVYLRERLAWYRLVSGSLSHNRTKLRKVTLDILRLLEQAKQRSDLRPWHEALARRERQCVEWLLEDAIRRRDVHDFVAWYDTYTALSTGSGRLPISSYLATRAGNVGTLWWLIKETRIREKLGFETIFTTVFWALVKRLVRRVRSCIRALPA